MAGASLPKLLAALDKPRLAAYARNLRFYQGEQWPAQRQGSGARRLTLNYARTLIDKVTSYVTADVRLEVRPPTLTGQPTEAQLAAAREAELVLAGIADENGLERLDYETETDAAVLGDGAYKVTWDASRGRVVITAPDVQGIWAWYDPYDPRRLMRVAHRYLITAASAAALGVGVSRDVLAVEDWTAETVELWVDQVKVESRDNVYGFVPFVVYPNLPVPKSPWGVSDIEAVRGAAEETNRVFSALSRILELSGNPIAVLAGVESSTDIAVAPGAVWELPGEAKAYLLDLLSGGGARVHIDYLDAVYRAIHDLGEVPRTAFGDNARSLSGVALEIELQPLQQKVLRKRIIRGDVYRRRAEMSLALLDMFTGTAHSGAGQVAHTWGTITPSDPNQDVTRESARVGAGLSSAAAAMGRLGEEDPSSEWAAILREREELPAAGAEVGGGPGSEGA